MELAAQQAIKACCCLLPAACCLLPACDLLQPAEIGTER